MDTTSEKESRRIARLSLALPVRVESRVDAQLSWNEITRLNDISAFGAGFNLKHNVKRGRLVQMTMPLPRQMRCYDYAEPQYRIWGLVRSCITKENPKAAENHHAVGVAFIGKRPPPSYLNDPNKLFEISHQEDGKLWNVVEASSVAEEKAAPIDLRRHSRLSIPTNINIEKLDADGNVTASEATVTENLSLSGAAVFSMLEVEVGEFVRVKSEQYNVSIISVVRARRFGQDGIPRLHVEFVDRFFPLEGIS
ncbi:MAG: PilZ domain-containing protein [Pyrinomonadaceae bacterium]|nr:PilZ domain-containing protein [Pyrinomonadaceae bacterium]